MPKDLCIKEGEALLVVDDKVYKLPKGIDLIKKYGNNSKVIKRTRELAKKYGMKNFIDFNYGINCLECSHTLLYEIAAKEGIAIHPGGKRDPLLCRYEGNNNVDLISLWEREEKKLFGLLKKKHVFMAKELPVQ